MIKSINSIMTWLVTIFVIVITIIISSINIYTIMDSNDKSLDIYRKEVYDNNKDMITYETEFVNKTKQTYLNIKGEFKREIIGFENDINVHLRIDTDIYDGYEVHIEDGLVTVILHEIKNEAPVLKDYGTV